MAPEQARGETEQLDERTDVFALGALLAFLVGGAIEGAAPAAGSITPVLRWERRVPRALRAVVEKAMSEQPAGRYAGAGDLSAEIGRFLEGRPVLAHPESAALRAGRFLWRHRVAVILLLVYAAVRAALLRARGS
jgi:serine/threonine-protein kinase